MTEEGTFTCQPNSESNLFSRDSGDLYSNLTEIAEALAKVKDVVSDAASTTEQGLANVGCAAQQAFQQATAYYFNMVQNEVGVVEEVFEIVSEFFEAILGYNTKVTGPVSLWIDETDMQFQSLACLTNSPSGQQSRIWRTLEQHSSLHAGLNTLMSISNVVTTNFVEDVLRLVFTGMTINYEEYIVSGGSITEGWTQAWRICTTKWDIDSLEQPENEEPDEDDEDDWLPRYQIFTTPDASMAQLKALEHALGGGGWEISSANSTDWIKGYVVDLNILQATLPSTLGFVNSTYRFVWDGSEGDSIIGEPTFSTTPPERRSRFSGRRDRRRSFDDKSTKSATASEIHKRAFEPSSYPEPTGSQKLKVDSQHYLKTISQQKGQSSDDYTDYTYAEPRGEGSWIIIIDSGFDVTHKQLQSTEYRKVLTYAVPASKAVPKLTKWDEEDGWRPTMNSIADDLPNESNDGHGTGVACVAAGLFSGVASRANLLLVKPESHYLNVKTGETRQPGITLAAIQDAFSNIRDEIGRSMDFGKVVINLSMVLGEGSAVGSMLQHFFQSQDMTGVTIVMAAGNYGYDYSTNAVVKYQAESSPQKYVSDASPFINVGGTYHDGSVWEWTTPPGARPGGSDSFSEATISVWAQADDVWTCRANAGGANEAMFMREGTSFAAPQVAGLAASLLSYPWPSTAENPFAFVGAPPGGGSVGRRMKTMLADTYAYQRLPRGEIANRAMGTLQSFRPPRAFPWAIPDRVDVIYNMAFGDQRCKNVPGFPNVKRDDTCPLSGDEGGTPTAASTASYVTDEPTYESKSWTGFSTATGSSSTASEIHTSSASGDSGSETVTPTFTPTFTLVLTATVTPGS